MYRKSSNFLDYGIEADTDPKIKFNSLLSATVSTIMCLAAKCPLPKRNVETTKLFLSKITDETGQSPMNIKSILKLLEKYNGPYTDVDPTKEKRLEKIHSEPVTAEIHSLKDAETKLCLDYDTSFKSSQSSVQIPPKDNHIVEAHTIPKRITKSTTCKRTEKDPKKLTKSLGARVSSTKSMISKY